jgi:hypothetical protein
MKILKTFYITIPDDSTTGFKEEIAYEYTYICEICGMELGKYENNVPLTLNKSIDGEKLELHFCSEKCAIDYLLAEQDKQRG